jgi:hypothetical protein
LFIWGGFAVETLLLIGLYASSTLDFLAFLIDSYTGLAVVALGLDAEAFSF